MTIQELKTREENRKKNQKLIQEGRIVVVEVGENYKQKRIFVDGVDVFPFWEDQHKEHLSKYDFLQLKEEEEARIKARKEYQEEKAAMLTLFNDFLKNNNFMLDAEDMTITTTAGDYVAFIDYNDIKKTLKYNEEERVTYIELLKEKAERSKNWDNNIKTLAEAEKAGIIESYNYKGFIKGGKFYFIDDYYKYHNLDDRGGIVNFIIKTNEKEEEEKAKQEEARQAEEERIIKLLNQKGVSVKLFADGSSSFYYKRAKVLHLDWYYKIVTNHNGRLTINSDILDLLNELQAKE